MTEPVPTEYVAAEILRRLVDDLTVEDVRRSRAEFPEGDPMRGFASVYYAAVRTGLTDDETLEEFLARVRIKDLGPILTASAASLPEGPSDGGSSPPSVASGA